MKIFTRVLLFALLLTFPWGVATAQVPGAEPPVDACLQVRFLDRESDHFAVWYIELKLKTRTYPYTVVSGELIGDDLLCRGDWQVEPDGVVGLNLRLKVVDVSVDPCPFHVFNFTGFSTGQPPGWNGIYEIEQARPLRRMKALFMGYTKCPRP